MCVELLRLFVKIFCPAPDLFSLIHRLTNEGMYELLASSRIIIVPSMYISEYYIRIAICLILYTFVNVI